ncbi:MAG TPA: aminoglycoside phosphotransferase family protein, partial [Anaerolineaceae bacterium]
MLEKPDLADEQILACLRDCFGIRAKSVAFLPIGNDATAWAYRVDAAKNEHYFLKIKKGTFYPASLTVPRYLHDHGLSQVVAPLPGQDKQLWQPLREFRLILYPFIEGRDGMSAGLTSAQWRDFGRALERIHATRLPAALAGQMRREDFRPPWEATVRELAKRIAHEQFRDPCKEALADFWQSRAAEIERITARTEALGAALRSAPPEFVLCHSDIHTANILVEPGSDLAIIDWDYPQFAPAERDLMFVVGAGEPGQPASQDEQCFFEGYGPAQVNQTALAYYRYEWVVQEIGDYGARVFLSSDGGEVTRQASVQGFRALFDAGDVIEAAY